MWAPQDSYLPNPLTEINLFLFLIVHFMMEIILSRGLPSSAPFVYSTCGSCSPLPSLHLPSVFTLKVALTAYSEAGGFK